MLPSSWRQWLSATRLRLHYLGKTVEEGLVTTLQRHFRIRNPAARPTELSKVLIYKESPALTRRLNLVKLNANKFGITPGKSLFRARLLVGNPPLGSTVLRFSSDKLHSLGFWRSTAIRSLFSNWDVNPSLRESQLRNIYSIRSIRSTNEAVRNLLLALRRYASPEDSQRPANYESELFNLMNSQKMNTGSFVQFDFTPSLASSVRFLSSDVLSCWKEEIRRLIEIEGAVEKIWQNYGSLPIKRTSDSIRVYFPSLGIVDTERLISDLGISHGVVYPDYYSVNNSRDVSRTPSVTNMHEFKFSPVLSDF